MKDFSDRQMLAIEYLRQNKTLKSKTYANMANVSLPIAVRDLSELVKFRYLKKIGVYRGTYYVLASKK